MLHCRREFLCPTVPGLYSSKVIGKLLERKRLMRPTFHTFPPFLQKNQEFTSKAKMVTSFQIRIYSQFMNTYPLFSVFVISATGTEPLTDARNL
jgi:hypothetical protein